MLNLCKYKSILLIFLMGVSCSCSAVAQETVLVNHKALYDFKLLSVEPGMGLNDVRGKMFFEQEDVCDAWTADHRFTTEHQYAEQPPVLNTSHYVAFESKDGKQFNFSSERQENGETTEQLRGHVEAAADGTGKAIYSRPDNLKYDLPKGYFLSTAHTIEIIRRARAGERSFNAVVFDGTDADGPVEINTFIGKKATADEIRKIAAVGPKIDTALLVPEAWHIRMAVFPLINTEDMSPSYEMDMLLHDNGVVSDAQINYKTFKLRQSLSALEKLPQKKCD